jgi:hypothetical protein
VTAPSKTNRHLKRLALALALGWLSALASTASAEPQGIFDVARPDAGCSCHAFGPYSTPPSLTTVRVFVDDQPLELFGGYQPGSSYKLTVWVLGLLPVAGFNLEASAGTLTPLDAASHAVNLSECGRLQRQTACIGQSCQVLKNDECPVFDARNPSCQKCSFNQLNTAACRTCDATTIVDVQATHTAPNRLPFFDLTWTAPSAPVDVEMHVAGNKAPGLGGNLATAVAFWNFAEPIVLHPAQ